MTKICEVCHKRYETNSKWQKYCSKDCKKVRDTVEARAKRHEMKGEPVVRSYKTPKSPDTAAKLCPKRKCRWYSAQHQTCDYCEKTGQPRGQTTRECTKWE